MKRGVLDPVIQESTPAIVARKIRDAIASGQFAPGTQLTETQLAKELGVSRGPLREAMQRLTQEGLLVSYRNRGLFVISMEQDDYRDIYMARTAVEGAAIAQLINSDHVKYAAQLMETVSEMEKASEFPAGHDITMADLRFHALLVQLAQSPRLQRMHDTLLTETLICLNALKETYATADKRIVEHRGIAEAIGLGDLELAEQRLMDHMDDALARLIPSGNVSES